MALESAKGAHNYAPIPVVLSKGEGVHVWDVDGKQYYDFLSAYSAVNHGHCHPRLVEVMQNQAAELTLTSRAFYNDKLGPFCDYITSYFGFDRVLPMNTGVEAVETAMKLCRRWGYDKKRVPPNEAVLLFAKQNFHGRTLSVVSASTDPDARRGFGPFIPNVHTIEYNDLGALEAALKQYPNTVGLILEPIQGEAGVVVPDEGYLTGAHNLCKKHGALFVADEVQTGLCRTGRMLAVDYEDVKPDVLILGKALSGGMMPVSAVLANDEVMMNISPGEHGSTYGGNPLGCVIGVEALKIMKEDGYAERAYEMGKYLRAGLRDIQRDCPQLTTVRGKGLLNAIVIEPSDTWNAWDACLEMADNGLLAKPTHGDIIRFAPPLVITKPQMDDCLGIIADVLRRNASKDE